MNQRILGKSLILMLMVGFLLAPPAHAAKNQWKQDIDAEPGQTLHVNLKDGGSLIVKGWDEDRVEVVCTVNRNELEDYDFDLRKAHDGVEFEAKLNDRDINSTNLDVEVRVPREFDLDTKSAGGSIDLSDLKGEFRGSTGGGEIHLENLEGEVRLTTGGGRLEISDSHLDGRVTTGGGGGLVRNVTGSLKATSGGGAVRFENVRDRHGDLRGPAGVDVDGASEQTIMYTTAGGPIDIDGAPYGAIVSTGGGDIEIRDASRKVRATTGGGSIDIEIEDGTVVATTGAGDIDVSVSRGLGKNHDGVELTTGFGRVTVTLPADASVEFDLDLGYTRSSDRDFEIRSDFDMEIEHTDEWQREHGSNYWKHVYGTGTVNGGAHRVTIKSVNGDIVIKKK